MADDLYAVLEAARIVALLIAPLLPDLAERMLAKLAQAPLASGVPEQASSDAPASPPWSERLWWGGLVAGTPLPEPAPVMARLELEETL